MKKFLSLVLALVMTMSLVTISAGAKDFADDADINYDAAVEVMSALKVIDGYTDGSFRPATELNRGAAAKIICNMILGPTTASALSASSAPFVDVPADSVFAGYITYCSKEGIINGYADGTFRPTAPLTGYAFAKMLLGALGYDPDLEGYTGANWGVNVAKQAIGIGLDDGIDGFSGTAYVTREAACQMAMNALQCTMVEYDSKTSVTVNGAEVVIGGSEADEMSQSGYEDTMDAPFLQFAEKYFPNLKTRSADDAFGRPATEWFIKNKSVGVFTDTPDLVYTEEVKGKTIYADLGVSDPVAFEVYMDGDEHGSDKANPVAMAAGLTIEKKGTNADKKMGAQGRLTEVYYDADANFATIVMVNTYAMEVNGDYDDEDETLTLAAVTDVHGLSEIVPLGAGEDVLSSDDFAGLDQYKDEDIVLVTVADGEVKSIVAPEMVTAVIDEHVVGESVTADGSEYKFAWFWAAEAADDDMNYIVDDSYDLYMDAYGNVIYSEAVETEYDYVYIYEFAENSFMTKKSSIESYAYFLDGTEGTIAVKKVDGKTVKKVDLDDATKLGYTLNSAEGQWFKFTVKDDVYELTKITRQELGAVALDVTVEDSVMINVTRSVAIRGNKGTQFIVVDADDDVSVYTGIKNAPVMTTSGADARVAVVLDKNENYADYVFVDLGAAGTMDGTDDSSDFVFLSKFEKHGTDSADNNYYRFKGLLNGEEGKIRTEMGLKDKATAYGHADRSMYIDVKYDSDSGYIKAMTDLALVNDQGVNVYLKGASASDTYDYLDVTNAEVTQKAGVISIKDEESLEGNVVKYYLTDDATITVIETDDDVKSFTAKKLVSEYGADLDAEIYGVMNDDGDYTALFIELK